MVKYLIGRYVAGRSCGRIADPIFGVVTGVGAFYLWETDPRNAADHGEGHRLWDLLSRRWGGHAPMAQSTAPAPVTLTSTSTALQDKKI